MQRVEEELLRDAVRTVGRCRMRVGGFCMTPSIRHGAWVIVERIDPSALSAGDIAVYSIDGRLFTHRMVSREGTALRFRGDQPGYLVHDVVPDMIIGKVTGIENPPLIKRLFERIRTHVSRIVGAKAAVCAADC
jgi:SOS-response transcriptional repressor LexA